MQKVIIRKIIGFTLIFLMYSLAPVHGATEQAALSAAGAGGDKAFHRDINSPEPPVRKSEQVGTCNIDIEGSTRIVVYREQVLRYDRIVKGRIRIDCVDLKDRGNMFLSYHVYDAEQKLLEWDGDRFPLHFESGSVSALYEIPLRSYLEKAPQTEVVKFVFDIGQGEYWHSRAHLDFKGAIIEVVPISVDIKVYYAFLPRIVAADSQMAIPSLFDIRSESQEVLSFRPSVETFPLKGTLATRHESARGRIPRKLREALTLATLVPYDTPPAGLYLTKLGFVHEGVMWYSKIGWTSPVRICLALPMWLFIILGSTCLVFLVRTMRMSPGGMAYRYRIPILLALILGTYYFVLPLVFTNFGLLFVVPLVFLSLVRLEKELAKRLVCMAPLAFLISLEIYWALAKYHRGYATFISLSVISAAYMFFLFAFKRLSKNIKVAASVSGFLVIMAMLYYLSMDIYYSFFRDYPSIAMIGNANQIFSVRHSIYTLFNHSHLIVALSGGLYMTFLVLQSVVGCRAEGDGNSVH